MVRGGVALGSAQTSARSRKAADSVSPSFLYRPLPDESKASSASLLIKRFQAQISSDEPPLVPSSSFGSPGRPRNSLIAPPGGASIGVRLDETRKSLEGSRKDFFEKIPLDDNGGVRPWLKSTSTAAAATSLPPESQAGEGRAAPVPIVTRPSVDVPVPALTTLDGSDFGGLPAKEGLSRPTSPLVQSGRLSAPPPTDDNSPPPSPIFGSSPSIVVPDSAPLPFPTSSPPHSEARSSPPNTATSRQQPTRPARTGSVHIPTTASLLKTKPRVSNSSSPSTPRAVSPATSTRSRTTSRVSTPHLASPPLPSSTKMSPSSSRSSLGISSFAGGSPSLSSSTTTRRPRSNSNASAVSTATTVGGTPRKAAVPTTGTPRSRAAAAAAAALAAGGEVPAVPTTPARKSATSTRTPVKTPSSVTPAKARTPVVATKVFPTAVRTTPSAVGRASTSSTSATRGSTASVRGARGASTAATRGGAAKKLTSEPRVVVKVPPSDPVVSGVEAKKPDGEVETGGEGTEGPAATPSDDVAALSVVGGENDAPADGKSEKIHHVTSPSDALVSSEIGEGSAAGGSEAGAGAEVELELEETAPGIEEAAPGVKEYAPGFEDAAEDEKHTHSVEPSDSEDFPDIPDDNGEDLGTEVGGAEEKVFAGIGEKPVGKVGMEVVEDGEGGIVAVGAELLETASA